MLHVDFWSDAHRQLLKVTAEDMIAIQAHLPVEIGETISLEKILLVGGTDFSIIGRPLIDKTMVS